MNYRAIITDLDRTLLRTDKSLSAFTVSVLRKAKEKGLLLVAATARPWRTVTEYDYELGFDAAVCLNGAEIICRGDTKSNCIPHGIAAEFLQKLCGRGEYVISAEIGGVLYANTVFPEWESVYYTGFPRLPQGTLHKIILTYSEETLNTVKEIIPDELYCTVANKQLIQIMHKNATKWNGVCSVLGNFNLSPQDAVYFGDDNDDTESMLRCGLSVAVDNAIPTVKNAADRVTLSNDADGVAVFIEDNLL